MSGVDRVPNLDPAAALRSFTDVLEAIDGVPHGTASLVVGGMQVDVTRTGEGVTGTKGQS